MSKSIRQHIEALLFTAKQPLTVEVIKLCLDKVFEEEHEMTDIQEHLSSLAEQYSEGEYAFELVTINEGYQFLTKTIYHQTIATLEYQRSKKRLSRAAMETLSIIAYKQPVTKVEMEQIRGVSCDYSIQKLLEKDLISIMGRSDAPGKPILYGTSNFFMNYFGLNSLEDLPKLKDIQESKNEIGEAAEQVDIIVGKASQSTPI